MPKTMTPKPPTVKQLRYLRFLAQTTGTTFTPPKTIGEARGMIDQMKGRRRTRRAETTRERREVAYDMATKRGDAAKVQARELGGYGSSAIWATPPTEEVGPRVVNIHHEDYDVLIDRTTKWGNPFVVGRDGTREQCIEKYETWALTQPHLMAALHELRGQTLGCHCKPKGCHGDPLVRWANAARSKTPTPSASASDEPSPFLCYTLGIERRTIVVQRIGGKISVRDLPADGNGARHLVVDRTDDLRTCGELNDVIADYIRQTQRLGSVPLGPAEIERIIQAAA